MAYEVITLNLIPSGEVPVIHAAQYDVDRPLMFALKLGEDEAEAPVETESIIEAIETAAEAIAEAIESDTPEDTEGGVE